MQSEASIVILSHVKMTARTNKHKSKDAGLNIEKDLMHILSVKKHESDSQINSYKQKNIVSV